MTMTDANHQAFVDLIEEARRVSADVGDLVAEVLDVGTTRPLNRDEAQSLLTRVIEVVREGAARRGDRSGVAVLERDVEGFINRVVEARQAIERENAALLEAPRLELQSHNGIAPRPVRPNPVFHERDVPVVEGFVRTKDIQLWDENARIDIHLNQFEEKHGRRPEPHELLDIMIGTLRLEGIGDGDQFEIVALANSIRVNGVRKPPIIDVDGTLLDGNRRITACYYILNSSEFSPEEKRRAEWIQVWQLTAHATDEDREAVIVSLNFEPDNKQDWPEYVKARKVFDEWQAFLALEAKPNPPAARQREIKREIARKFALSINEVTRYIQMVGLAEEFEDHHVATRGRDTFAAKHKAERYFQYFDELGKGKSEGGIYWTLNQEDAFKSLVFDLLYDGKFSNWNKIRDLKYIFQNEDAMEYLRRAREEPDVETAQEHVDDAIGLARARRADIRQVGANTRVRDFVKWFKDLPLKAFRPGEPGAIDAENLVGLRDVLRLVEQNLDASDSSNRVSGA